MLKKTLIYSILFLILTSCGGAFKPKKVDTRKTPINVQDRAKKNIKEGKGSSLGDLVGRRGGTSYEFSTSNPMWRASLEILDFLPLSTVDYSGGLIISDWYSDGSTNESIKITVRFLGNDISSENIKIAVHKKVCNNNNCKVNMLNKNIISDELKTTIIRKAALLQKDSKKKK
tara:strand:+ start:441 stop:959 length:519 start_codon:yes stop_codon:yes gene_type:complete